MTTLLTKPPDKSQVVAEVRPLVLHVRPALEMSDDQFFALCQLNRDLRIEQPKEGDWIIMPPRVGRTGSRNNDLARQLGTWAFQDDTGIAFDSSTGFVLPNGAKRSPDGSWVTRPRLAPLTPEQKQKFLPLCPDFVVELRSPSDSLAATQEKVTEYLQNGARLGWLIDAAERRVHVYRPGAAVQVHDQPDTLSADPVLPGFVLGFARIWDPGF